jgi:hypothetical protein
MQDSMQSGPNATEKTSYRKRRKWAKERVIAGTTRQDLHLKETRGDIHGRFSVGRRIDGV